MAGRFAVLKSRRLLALAGLVVFFVFLMFASASFALRGAIFEVGKYNNDYPNDCPTSLNEGRCCDDCTNLCNTNASFYHFGNTLEDFMTCYEAYEFPVARYQNSSVDDIDFYTRTNGPVPNASWARDYLSSGLDYADVAFYAGHGSMRCEHEWDDPNYNLGTSWAMHDQTYNASKYTMGDDNWTDMGHSYSCDVLTTNGSDSDFHVMLGGGYTPVYPDQAGNIKVMLNWGCRQGYYWVWHGGGFDSVRTGTMAMWNGWHSHGQMGDTWVSYFYDYVDVAMGTGGAGEAWVDMTIFNRNPLKHDHCLTSVVWGTSNADMDSKFVNGWLGSSTYLPQTTNPTQTKIYFYGGCSPYPWQIEVNPLPPYNLIPRIDGLDLPGTRGTETYHFKYGS